MADSTTTVETLPRRSLTLLIAPSAPELHTPPGILLSASRHSSHSMASSSGSSSCATPNVKFAPLPVLEARKRSSSSTAIGIASRGAMLRQRMVQQQNHIQHYYYEDEDPSGFSTYPYNIIPRSAQPRRAMEEEDEALAALGKIINDATKSLWRKISRKKKKLKDEKDVAEGTEQKSKGGKAKENGAPAPPAKSSDVPPVPPLPQSSDPSLIVPQRKSSLRRKELQLEKVVPHSVVEEEEEDSPPQDDDVPETPKAPATVLSVATSDLSEPKAAEVTATSVEVHVVEPVGQDEKQQRRRSVG